MPAMDTLQTLNLLLKTSRYGEQGFRTCAEALGSSDLREVMNQRAEQCARGAEELRDLIRRQGGEPDDGTSVPGDMHRGWLLAREALTGHDDHAILEECERGEDVALRDFRMAMQQDLPQEVRQVVEAQMQGVQRNHDQVKALRDAVRDGGDPREALRRAGQGSHDSATAGQQDEAGRFMQWTLAQVRLHPFQSMGVAALIGMLGWRALARRPAGMERLVRRLR